MTTPDVISLHRTIADMVDQECDFVFMEVSSHAIDQKRIEGLRFSGGIFTNITHDHLDYHGDFKSYLKTKKKFFDMLPNDAFVLTNIDDKNGEVMIQNAHAQQYKYSMRQLTDFKAKLYSEESIGMHLSINGQKFLTRLNGRFNVYNLTCVYASAKILESWEDQVLIEKLSTLSSPSGRMEMVSSAPRIIVDYAHTPDALENVLLTLASSTINKLITVVGCGGDRDKAKRPKMGKIASVRSDQIILTSDNPRGENPDDIIKDMMSSLDDKEHSKCLVILDRKMAIKTAIALSEASDTIRFYYHSQVGFNSCSGVPDKDSEPLLFLKTY